jgi:uncharacterized protein
MDKKLVIDIDQIRKLSKRKEEENYGFRSFLKACEIPAQLIDKIVLRLFKEVAAKIDCKKCGNCCKKIDVALTEKDIANCSAQMNVPVREFTERFLVEDEESGKLIFNSKPCPFLELTKCSIYGSRPVSCRVYPHLQRRGLVKRLISVIDNSSICPIVYNVYEALKTEIWSMEDDIEDEEDFY